MSILSAVKGVEGIEVESDQKGRDGVDVESLSAADLGGLLWRLSVKSWVAIGGTTFTLLAASFGIGRMVGARVPLGEGAISASLVGGDVPAATRMVGNGNAAPCVNVAAIASSGASTPRGESTNNIQSATGRNAVRSNGQCSVANDSLRVVIRQLGVIIASRDSMIEEQRSHEVGARIEVLEGKQALLLDQERGLAQIIRQLDVDRANAEVFCAASRRSRAAPENVGACVNAARDSADAVNRRSELGVLRERVASLADEIRRLHERY